MGQGIQPRVKRNVKFSLNVQGIMEITVQLEAHNPPSRRIETQVVRNAAQSDFYQRVHSPIYCHTHNFLACFQFPLFTFQRHTTTTYALPKERDGLARYRLL